MDSILPVRFSAPLQKYSNELRQLLHLAGGPALSYSGAPVLSHFSAHVADTVLTFDTDSNNLVASALSIPLETVGAACFCEGSFWPRFLFPF